MTFRLGMTGSIGMGKSTTAGFFAETGIPVWDADIAVHQLYAPGKVAARAIGALFPDVLAPDGSVSRPLLRERIAADPAVLDQINMIVHPLVALDRAAFLAEHAAAAIVLLDIPLLFEAGLEGACDGIVVVTAPAAVQRQRVLDRGQMTDAEFDLILSRQMPDADKRARATWVIETTTLAAARAGVARVLAEIMERQSDA